MLSFAYKRFDGVVPEPGDLDAEDRALLAQVEAGFETVGKLYNACQFRAALNAALALDRKAPWFQIKEDPQAAATTVYVTQSVRAVDSLKTILAPSEQPPGQPLRQPAPLFKKLDESVIEEEYAELEG